MAIERVGSKVIKFYMPLAAYLIFLLFPFYWMVNTVFKSDSELYNLDLNPFYIHSPTLHNIVRLFTETIFLKWMAYTFVAGFIGSPAMNLFEAELNGTGDGVFLGAGDFTLDLPPEKTKHFQDYTEQKVIVGIRPEDFKQAADHSPGKTIPATVEVVEPIGNETYVNVAAGNVTLTAAVGRRTVIKPHSTLNLVPSFENMHLFDIRSKKSILKDSSHQQDELQP